MITLKSLHIYPLKSGRGHTAESVELDRFGPRGDRRWMLVDASGRFVSQREEPRMARLDASIQPGGLRLGMDGAALDVELPPENRARSVVVWEDQVMALDAGDAAAAWLQQQLGRVLRLVYMPEDSQRRVDPAYASRGETVSFADGFPLLLLSASSLDELNPRLSQPVELDRFRPNLVIEGCEPHAEDGWRQLRIGEVEFEVAKPCSRCAVPSLDQRTGEKHPELLRVLAGYRRGEDRKVYFGQNLLYGRPGRLTVGDLVEVLA